MARAIWSRKLSAPGHRRNGRSVPSLKIRKRIEDTFGWSKTVGGLDQTNFVGMAMTDLAPGQPQSRYVSRILSM